MNITKIAVVTNENSTIETGTLPVSLLLVILLAICTGIVFLQIYLSKKEGKWAGLILPFISISISLVVFLSVLLYSRGTETTLVDGEVVEQTITQIGSASSIIASAVIVLLLYNIPTGILLAIYAACKEKRKRKRDIEKMSVQDLG